MEKKKRRKKQYNITPTCNNCDYRFRSVGSEPCKSECGDNFLGWKNKKREAAIKEEEANAQK